MPAAGERGAEIIRVEVHVHTECSDDSVNTYADLEEAALEAGVQLYAITDHDTIEGALRLQERGRVRVIVGEEITTALGDVIGLFLREPIRPGLPPEETMDRIHAQGGLVYVPHPFDRKRKTRLFREAIDRCLGRIDLFEVRNGRTPHEEDNARAASFAAEKKLTGVTGSDAHARPELGRIFHEIPPFMNAAGFLAAIRAGRAVLAPVANHPSLIGRLLRRPRGNG
jgi:hypothetical protein